MKALLLGGAGFIGIHLARRLVRDGHAVTIVDDFSRGKRDREFTQLRRHPQVNVISGDLTAPATWVELPQGWDQIYLLAAVVGVRNVEQDPDRVVRVNTLAALHLLDWISPGEKVFFASTSEVYAGGVDAGIVPVPTPEDVPLMISDVTAPRFAYAVSKLLGEAAFLHAGRARGISCVIGRFHNVYGPRMGTDHVIPEMSLRAIRGDDPFPVRGADQYRAFCYVDDAVEAMVRLMSTPAAVGEIVHIGDDSAETRIDELAKIVLQVAGTGPALQTAPAPPGSVARRCPDLGKLRRLTGYQPGVPLEEGVRRTFEWYRELVAAPEDDASARLPIAFYYGAGELDRLAEYHRAVLQPEFYSPEELTSLRRRGVEPLAYLSLSEDHGPPAPWQRPDRNPDWGGAFVYVSHPGWVAHVVRQASSALDTGFTGLFLDALNVELTYPEDVPHLLTLVAAIRERAGMAYLLANRGFSMLPQMAELVDGVLFESFTVRWTDRGYAPWPPDVLEQHARIAERLLEFDLDLYALDYADTEGLAAFATRRAQQFGLHSFISDRALSRL
jgi:UDP-glucose 4-epimerase/UDP-glucuronate decarboxylase